MIKILIKTIIIDKIRNTNNNNDNIDRTIKKLSKSIVWFKLIISIVRNKHNEYSSVMITGN